MWYFIALIGNFVFSLWISHLYYLYCNCPPERLNWHGGYEFNATFWAINFLIIGQAGSSEKGGSIFWVISGILLFTVVRRFWLNWESADKSKS